MLQSHFIYGMLIITCRILVHVSGLYVTTADLEVALEGSKTVLRCIYRQENPTDTLFVVLWQRINPTTGVPTTIFNSQSNKGQTPRLRLVGKASLEIGSVNQTDEGEYRCQVTPLPSFEQDESMTQLTVIYPPVFQHNINSTIYLNENDVTTLQCKAQGKPDNVTYTWYHQRPRLKERLLNVRRDRRKLRYVNGNSLSINGFIRRLEGTYRCVAENEAGSTQVFYYLHLNRAAQFQGDHFRTIQILEGDDVTMELTAKAVPSNITYKWYYEGKPIDLFGWSSYFGFQTKETMPYLRISRTVSGTKLEIKEVSRVVAGVYTCTAFNGVGTEDSVNITLDVQYSVKISQFPYPAMAQNDSVSIKPTVEAISGNSLFLHCSGTGNPMPWYEWETPTSNVISSLQNSHPERHTVHKNGTIVIQPVERVDTGRFRCSVFNGVGFALKTEVFIKVLYPPVFKTTIHPVYDVRSGNDITVSCDAEAVPEPTYSWFKDSQEVAPGILNQFSYLTNNSSILHLKNITSSNRGLYRCHVTNYLGMIFKETQINVLFPSNITTPSLNLRSVVSEDVNITCITSGYPLPNVEWSHSLTSSASSGITIASLVRNGTRGRTFIIESNRTPTTLQSTLMISRLGVRDFGIYYCSSINSLGRDKVDFNLIKIDIPPTPVNLKLETLNKNNISITWSVTSEFLDGERFYCEVRLHSDLSILTVISCAVTSCFVGSLNESTTYSLAIFGRNKAGQGEKSNELIITTLGSPSTTQPTNSQNTTKRSNYLLNQPHTIPITTNPIQTTTIPPTTSIAQEDNVAIRDVTYDVTDGCVRWKVDKDLENNMTLWNSSNISRCVKVEVKMIGRSIWHPIAWCVAVWTEICRVSLASNRTWDVRVKICRGVNQGCGGAVKATSVTPPTSVIDTTLGLSPDFTWLEAIISSTIAVVLVVLVYLFSYAYFSNRRRMMDNDVCLNFHRRRQLLCNITEEVCRRSNSAITARPPISIPERRFKTFPGNSSRCLPLPS